MGGFNDQSNILGYTVYMIVLHAEYMIVHDYTCRQAVGTVYSLMLKNIEVLKA